MTTTAIKENLLLNKNCYLSFNETKVVNYVGKDESNIKDIRTKVNIKVNETKTKLVIYV